MADLKVVMEHYIDCALWTDEEQMREDNPNVDVNVHNIAEECLADIKNDCENFIALAGDLLEEWSDEQAGHDFWLTRNGHGAGFWDRGMGTKEIRDKLTEIAESFGSSDVYVGDTGVIYFT